MKIINQHKFLSHLFLAFHQIHHKSLPLAAKDHIFFSSFSATDGKRSGWQYIRFWLLSWLFDHNSAIWSEPNCWHCRFLMVFSAFTGKDTRSAPDLSTFLSAGPYRFLLWKPIKPSLELCDFLLPTGESKWCGLLDSTERFNLCTVKQQCWFYCYFSPTINPTVIFFSHFTII